MSTPCLKIDWASHDAAATACRRWHYSRTLPVPPLVKCGVWEREQFIGVVLFSRGASQNLLRPYGLRQEQGCELTRVALRAHESPVSRIVAIAMRFMHRANPGLRLVVSFADPNHGHVGGIYQAGNWLYSGVTGETIEYETANGERWHARQVSKHGVNRQFGAVRRTPKTSDCKRVVCQGKHRYLMPLDAAMREQLKPLALPYPKRPKQAMAATSGTATG